MDRRQFLARTLTLLPAAAAYSGTTAPRWGEDIDLLERAYTQLHPGLHRYLSKERCAAGFAKLRRGFASTDSLSGAYLQLAAFLATIRCGHTYANYYNQKRAVSAALFGGRTRLPVHFRWLGGRMIVTRNFSGDAALDPGAELIEVNGQAAPALLRELMRYANADGHNDAKRRALLSVQGNQGIEAFDVYQGLARPPSGDTHRLKVRLAGSRGVRAIDAPALDLEARRKQRAGKPDENAPAWTLSWPGAAVAVITMPTWALYDSTWKWREFLDASFAEIRERKATGLVLDLRGNEGGLGDCGDVLLSFLASKEITREASVRKVKYRRVPDELNAHLDTWDDSFRDWKDAAIPIDDGWFRLADESGAGGARIVPRDPGFRGAVAVLVDSENSSATFSFARTIQENRLGTLVGEPTGGNKRGINGGAFFFLKLPNSGLEADLPLIGYFPEKPQRDEGLTPDAPAAPTIDDIRTGMDRAMSTALGIVGVR